MKGKRERTIITILVALAITIAMFTTFPSSELKTFLPPDVYGKWYAFSIGQTISWNLLFYIIIWLTEHKNRIHGNNEDTAIRSDSCTRKSLTEI